MFTGKFSGMDREAREANAASSAIPSLAIMSDSLAFAGDRSLNTLPSSAAAAAASAASPGVGSSVSNSAGMMTVGGAGAPPHAAMLQETSLSLTRVLEQHTQQVKQEYEERLREQRVDSERELELQKRDALGELEKKDGSFREAMLVRGEGDE